MTVDTIAAEHPTPPYTFPGPLGGDDLVLAVVLPGGSTTVATALLPSPVVDALRQQTDPALFQEV